MRRILSIAVNVYKHLLHLFPESYRIKFAEDMLLDFSDLAEDASRLGTLALLSFFLHEVRDFPANLLCAHTEENNMFRIFHSQPINFGLRSALGFGIVFAFALPISMFVSDILFFPVDSVVTRLSIYYYDRFHVELGFELISWIPIALSHLLTGLVLGVLFALLFTDRSKYPRYILAGTLGWFLHNAIHDVFAIFFNTWVFLDGNQFVYFSYILSAFSGAIFGLVFIVAKGERYEVVHWLTIGVFVYPLFAYLWVEQLSNFLVFNTPWRFVGLTILMMILIASVFILARNIDSRRKLPWVVIAGSVGYPALSYLVYFIAQLISPPNTSSGILNSGRPFYWLELALSNGAYGILFGLLLGMVLGFQKKGVPPGTLT